MHQWRPRPSCFCFTFRAQWTNEWTNCNFWHASWCRHCCRYYFFPESGELCKATIINEETGKKILPALDFNQFFVEMGPGNKAIFQVDTKWGERERAKGRISGVEKVSLLVLFIRITKLKSFMKSWTVCLLVSYIFTNGAGTHTHTHRKTWTLFLETVALCLLLFILRCYCFANTTHIEDDSERRSTCKM